ncbi:MAG: hypothetical protein O2930_04515 [Acidobacteria bacterium]|nr:hypothetical protein [Acidobacteriota bacterium]
MIVAAWRDGFGRVFRAPALLAGVFATTVLIALPLAMSLRGMIEDHLGRSLVAGAVADGMDYDWWQEFTAQTSGLSGSFSPVIIGFASTLGNISGLLDAQQEVFPVAGAIAVYLLAWTFLSGGIIDRYARQRPTRAHGFFAVAGAVFWRFLRLGFVVGAAYWWLFSYVHPWLFDDAYTRLTRDITTERAAFLWRAVLYAWFGAALVVVNLVADYARIRMVVDDRRSVIGGLAATVTFIGRHGGRVCGLYALNGLVFMLLLTTWAFLAPGTTGMGPSMWLAVVATQLFLLARLLLKLQFIASQTALYQRSQAHATYAAAPEPMWPESPAAEAIVGGPLRPSYLP